MNDPLTILGFGGHARSVADLAYACNYKNLLFLDEQARSGEEFLGHPVLQKTDQVIHLCFPAAGNNLARKKQWLYLQEQGWSSLILLSPYASKGLGSTIEPGCFVGHHAHIGPMARIGLACIINTAAIVEHECVIGDFSHIAVNATVAGRVKIGASVFVGAGAVIRDGIEIKDNITIGAGSVVVKDLIEPGVYAGVPAKLLPSRS